MGLNKKLSQWLDAGLIDQQTAQNISEYEKSSAKPMVLWAAGGLGAFAIIVGIVAVVAANWLHVPDELKLGVDLALCAGLAVAVYQCCLGVAATQERLWLRELLVIIYYGFTLASMALIGQTYQLDGSLAKLILVWTLVTLPLVLLARGKFMAVLWVVGTALCYGLNISALYDLTAAAFGFSQTYVDVLTISLAFMAPLFFIYLSRITWLQNHRPIYAEEISRCSWLVIILAGFFAQFMWYSSHIIDEIPMLVFFITGAATGVTVLLMPRLYKNSDANTHLAMRVVLLLVFCLAFTACWHTTSMNVVGALSNLVYLSVLAWAALKIGSRPLFNFVTAVLSLRILFVYFEVFGSMLQTGIGLISGGILTLLLAGLWLKKSSALATQLTAGKAFEKEGTDAA